MEKAKRIILKGDVGRYEEGILDTAAKPGQCVTFKANGNFDPAVPTTANMVKEGIKILLEDALQGERVVGTPYDAGDTVFIYTPVPGDVLHVLTKAGEDVAVADKGVIEGGGSGKWIEGTSEAAFKVEFLESSNGALAADTLLRARVL